MAGGYIRYLRDHDLINKSLDGKDLTIYVILNSY